MFLVSRSDFQVVTQDLALGFCVRSSETILTRGSVSDV